MSETTAMDQSTGIRSRHPDGTVVAIGKFESIHRGHRTIMDRVNEVAREKGLGSVVLTFRKNPLRFLDPESYPRPVMSPERRIATLRDLGIQEVAMIEFDEEFAKKTPRQFVEKYLSELLGAKHVIVGDDFKFGATASGTTDTLRYLGQEFGFTVEVVDEVTDHEVGRVSTTKIREMLRRGEVAGAARLLGQWHSVSGQVVHGDARGRDLGFPTANLGPRPGDTALEGYVPGDGVYAGYAEFDGVRHQAAISVGNNPTFTPDADSRVEVFLLEFQGDLYGKDLTVLFVDKVRESETFTGLDALVEQMHRDVENIRGVLDGVSVSSP